MKALCIFVGLIGAAIIASIPPEFSNDSQYYVQSGILWARGDVTYAGYLVGSRILAILYYHLPLVVFGPSIDAISLSLGFAFLAYAALITAWCFKAIRSTYIATAVALLAIIVGFIWLPWQSPLSEQIAIVLTLAVLCLLDASRRADGQASLVLLISAAIVCGLGTGVRSELAILFPLVIGALILDLSKKLKERLVAVVAMGIAFVIAAQVPSLAFAAFSGKEMPHQLRSYFLFFQALHELGDANNGPNSAQLAALGSKARLTLSQPVKTSDVRLGVGPAFAANGGAVADRLTLDAGLETLRARPGDFIRLVFNALSGYLYLVPGQTNTDWRSYEDRWRDARNKIKSIDDYRAESSPRFGGDALFPVATLFERRLLSKSPVLGGLPIVDVRPPAWAVTVIALFAVFLAIGVRNYSAPSAIAAAYFVSCVMLASISQGYVARYFLAASLPLLVAFMVDLGKLISERRARYLASPGL